MRLQSCAMFDNPSIGVQLQCCRWPVQDRVSLHRLARLQASKQAVVVSRQAENC